MGRPTVLKVDIVADAKGVGTGVADADRQLSGFGGSIRKHGAAIGAGLAVAGAAVFAFGKASVDAFVEAEQSAARLDDAYKRFPATNDVTRASFDSLNSALATKVKFDDDALASGQSVLAQYKLTGAQIQELTPMLADYAAKTGRDIPAAADVLGKALLGKGKALADVGIKFKDTGSVAGNYTEIMGGLRTQVGGFAEKEGKTAAGQAAILSNQFGEVKETVGAKLLPVLTTMTGLFLTAIGVFQRHHEVLVPVVAVVGALVGVVVLVNTAARAYAATQAALNIVLSANPVGLVVIAIAALVAGVILAYQHSETFRGIVDQLWKLIKLSPLGLLITHLGDVRDGFQWVIDKVEALIGWLGKIHIPDLNPLNHLPDLNPFSAPVLGMVSPTVGGAGGLGRGVNRLATASLGSGPGSIASLGGKLPAVVYVDRRTDARSWTVTGALDPSSVARQIKQLVDGEGVRTGTVPTFGTIG